MSNISYEYLEDSEKIKSWLTSEHVFAGRYITSILKAEEALGNSSYTMKAPVWSFLLLYNNNQNNGKHLLNVY